MLDIALPDQTLLDLVIQHHGVVTQTQLRAAGYSPARIRQLCREQVLAPQGEGYTLEHLTAFFDGLILVQWAIPDAIIGKVSAMVFHGLSVANPMVVDVCLPEDWRGTLPDDLGIRPFHLPAEVREYGVEVGYPSPPGDIPVKVYAPAVALTQVLADPRIPAETKQDCQYMYAAFGGDAGALQEAQQRYSIIFAQAAHALA